MTHLAFTARRYASMVYTVCLSVTLRYCIKKDHAKKGSCKQSNMDSSFLVTKITVKFEWVLPLRG